MSCCLAALLASDAHACTPGAAGNAPAQDPHGQSGAQQPRGEEEEGVEADGRVSWDCFTISEGHKWGQIDGVCLCWQRFATDDNGF